MESRKTHRRCTSGRQAQNTYRKFRKQIETESARLCTQVNLKERKKRGREKEIDTLKRCGHGIICSWHDYDG